MYLWLLRRLRGYVDFCIHGKNKEAVVNLAVERGLKLWNLKKLPEGIVGSVFAREYRDLSICARESSSQIHCVTKYGFPFYLYRNRHRKGMLVGGILALALLILSQNFIWKINFNNYDGADQEYLLSVMEDRGIKIGSYIPNLDFRLLQQDVLIEVEDISWLAFNINGTQLDVEVSKKLDPPEFQETTPCNIVAKKTGQILHIDVYSGQEVVREKDVVYKGDLLVSGIAADPSGKINQVSANASVIAQTTHSHTLSFSLKQSEHNYTGQIKNRYRFQALNFSLPLYINFSFPDLYDKTEEYHPFIIGQTEFPFGMVMEQYNFYQPKQVEYTQQQAREIIMNAFSQYETEELSDVKIVSYQDQESVENNMISITREYICEENIAKKIGFYSTFKETIR
jgi:similar to stage IV sporulation protein